MNKKLSLSILTATLSLTFVTAPQTALAAKPSNATSKNEQQSTHAASSLSLEDTNAIKEQTMQQIFNRAELGPKTIELGSEGTFKLPSGMLFINKEDANKLMIIWGNSTDTNRYGLIFPKNPAESDWWADLSYSGYGYVEDDEAQNWDAEEMLKNLKANLEEQNKARKLQGLPEIEINGWIEKPHYDSHTHRLIWSIDVREKNAAPDAETDINYNTFALSRNGFIALTLVTSSKQINQYKPVTLGLLSNISFKEGHRYTDFNSATDKVASYGITALVGGLIMAQKLGLLSLIGAFFVKFTELILVGVIAVGACIKKLFSKWRRTDQ